MPISRLPSRNDEGAVLVVIESPRGSALKLKYDPQLDAMLLSRPLPAGVVYPHDWGFIPSTHASDGDPLDAIVLWDGSSYPGVVIPCRLLGVLNVEQTNLGSGARERNDRIVAVPIESTEARTMRSVFDIPQRGRQELERFFLNAVAFRGKDLRILGWAGCDEAEALVSAAAEALAAR